MMSNFNYMEDVPVKISEYYKPLPKVLQIPKAITNKVHQPPRYYYECSRFSYDFQLERNILARISDWRCTRQRERELQQVRVLRLETKRLHSIEQQHKQMLGAVCYPDAEDLPANSGPDEGYGKIAHLEHKSQGTKYHSLCKCSETSLDTNEVKNFHNILKPTILPQPLIRSPGENTKFHSASHNQRNKGPSAINYKDFEDDTSSPFDNIELKAMNDLDMLAQVLRYVQLGAAKTDLIAQGEHEAHSINESIYVMTAKSKRNSVESNSEEVDKMHRNFLKDENNKSHLPDITANVAGEFEVPINYAESFNTAYGFASRSDQSVGSGKGSHSNLSYNSQTTTNTVDYNACTEQTNLISGRNNNTLHFGNAPSDIEVNNCKSVILKELTNISSNSDLCPFRNRSHSVREEAFIGNVMDVKISEEVSKSS